MMDWQSAIIALAYIWNVVFGQQDCGNIEYNFKTSEIEYVRGKSPTDLDYGSVCFEITTNDEGELLGTILSYVANGKPDTILLEGIVRGFRTAINGQYHEIFLVLNPNTDYNICVLLYLPDNYMKFYVNGVMKQTLEYGKTQIGSVQGNGVLVAGQRQACEGICFDTQRSYSGRLRNPLIWNRVLTETELQAFQTGICPNDFIVNFAPEIILPYGRLFTYSGCPSSTHIISNTGGSVEYLKYKERLPKLQSASICCWITTDSRGLVSGTVGSIANENSVDIATATGIMVNGTTTLRLHFHGKVVMLPVLAPPNTEHHFCLAISSTFQKVQLYMNGQMAFDLLLPGLQPIPQGSTVILGQRQGCEGGCFVAEEALNSTVRDFTIWGRVLSEAEIKAIVQTNECPTGQAVDMTKDNYTAHKA